MKLPVCPKKNSDKIRIEIVYIVDLLTELLRNEKLIGYHQWVIGKWVKYILIKYQTYDIFEIIKFFTTYLIL